MMKRLALVIAAVLALGGCAPTPPDPADFGVDDLIGMWRVQGNEENQWLRIDADSLNLWADCGVIGGTWDARDRSLVLAHGRSRAGCYSDVDVQSATWLDSVRGFSPTTHGVELNDADGGIVATLVNDGMPKPHEDAPELNSLPRLTKEDRQRLVEEINLPEGVQPVAELDGMYRRDVDGDGDLVGDDKQPESDIHVVFFPDAVFGHDGCAAWAGGAWLYTETGQLLRAKPDYGQEECFVEKGLPLDDVETIGQRGESIVFFDRDGREIAAFINEPL